MKVIKSVVVAMVMFSGLVNANPIPTDHVVQIYAAPGNIRTNNGVVPFKDIVITNLSSGLNITGIAFDNPDCKGAFVTPKQLGLGDVSVYRIINNCEYNTFELYTDKGDYHFGQL